MKQFVYDVCRGGGGIECVYVCLSRVYATVCDLASSLHGKKTGFHTIFFSLPLILCSCDFDSFFSLAVDSVVNIFAIIIIIISSFSLFGCYNS